MQTDKTGPGADTGVSRRRQRQRRQKSGLTAERIAALWLMMKGYRVLGTRVRTPVGEIDLVVIRANRLAFVEVKRRPNRLDAEAALTVRQRRRVRAAADLWLARNPRFQDRDICFDLVFLMPRHWPRHIKNGL
jgi:putative endonuclease